MKQNYFARRKRQLKQLVARLQQNLQDGHSSTSAEVSRLRQKIRHLLHQLKAVLTGRELQRILGGVAIFLGFATINPAQGQSFGPRQSNPFGITPTNYIALPTFADLDNDGDMDLLVGEYYGNLKYYQNTGSATNPQFATPVSNPFGIDTTQLGYISIPTFADLDNDGDMDLMVGGVEYYGMANMLYFENTGSATNAQFAPADTLPYGLTGANGFAIPTFADMDNDGDLDLLVGEYYGVILYYQNTGSASSPQFASPISSPFGLTAQNTVGAVAVADLDEDGDLDLLIGEYYGDLNYYENTGSASSPQFGTAVVNPSSLQAGYYNAFPAFADLDGDGDMDLLVGEYYGNMQYYENTSDIGLGENGDRFALSVFPNPASEYLQLDSPEHLQELEINSVNGERLMHIQEPTQRIELSALPKGQYLLRVTDDSGATVQRKITIQ